MVLILTWAVGVVVVVVQGLIYVLLLLMLLVLLLLLLDQLGIIRFHVHVGHRDKKMRAGERERERRQRAGGSH